MHEHPLLAIRHQAQPDVGRLEQGLHPHRRRSLPLLAGERLLQLLRGRERLHQQADLARILSALRVDDRVVRTKGLPLLGLARLQSRWKGLAVPQYLLAQAEAFGEHVAEPAGVNAHVRPQTELVVLPFRERLPQPGIDLRVVSREPLREHAQEHREG
jgi:hypothetical protein